MELIYDWKSFQTVFYPKKRLSQLDPEGPVYLVTEGKVIVSAFSEGECLSDWLGASFEDMVGKFSHREIVSFHRKDIDEWLNLSVDLTHYYDQMEFVRTRAVPQAVATNKIKNNKDLIRRHFLLQALQSWWQRVLPSTYGIYVRLDGDAETSILMVIQRGRLDSFHCPDLSSMIPDRKREPSSIVKYLSERHVLPVRGLFLTSDEWNEWSQIDNPWRQVFSSLRADRGKLVPFSWGLALLTAVRAYFNL